MTRQSFHSAWDAWTPRREPYNTLFNESERKRFFSSQYAYNTKKRTVVITAFENNLACLGGLASVTRYLPHYLAAQGERVVFISPFYKNIAAVKNARAAGEIAELFSNQHCVLAGFRRNITCYQHNRAEFPCYYIGCEDYFAPHNHPYGYDNEARLVEDALAFSGIVPFVLNRLHLTNDILIHCHDWETALLAVSSKIAVLEGILKSVRIVLTLHNSYDAGLPAGSYKNCFGREVAGGTVLQASIPFCDGPLTTVSTPFAFELMHDPLQTGVYVGHLQSHFTMNPPVGIRNGMFRPSPRLFSAKDFINARHGDREVFETKKNVFYRKLIEILSRTRDDRITGRLTFPGDSMQVPIFFMSGRFDIMQKGYDVIFHAFKRLQRGLAKLIFSPSNPYDTANSSDYSFFVECACACEGDITIWPFFIPGTKYPYFIGGSSYLVMPSFYEPFGAATEGFSCGTPVIARGTGGLWEQVQSAYPCVIPSYYSSILNDFTDSNLPPTGIVYREEFSGEQVDEEWRRILSSSPHDRMSSDLYRAMVDAACDALEKAVTLFHDKEKYYRLVMHGWHSLDKFNWNDTIENYRRIYSYAERNML